MKQFQRLKYTTVPAILLSLGFAFSSCYKEPFYKCEVLVTDFINTPLPGAIVKISSPVPPNDTIASDVTNSSGIAAFEFPLEAVYNVTVRKGNLSGSGFIKLENRQTVKETVVIQ